MPRIKYSSCPPLSAIQCMSGTCSVSSMEVCSVNANGRTAPFAYLGHHDQHEWVVRYYCC